jgi:hypothetical protein
MMLRILRWLALAVLLALFWHGLHDHHLLGETSWTPEGLYRLIWWIQRFAIYLLLIVLWRPGWLIPLTLGGSILYTALGVGLVPVFVVGFFLLSSVTLGRWILKAKEDTEALDDLLALLAGVAVYMFTVGVLVRFPVNYPVVYGILFALPIALRWQNACEILHRLLMAFRSGDQDSRLQQLSCGLFLFVLCSQWLVVLKPEVSADGLAMHLALPAAVAFHHRWDFDVTHTVWAVMPMGADWCFSAVYLLGGEYAARLLNFAIFAINLSLLYWTIRRWLSHTTAYLILALFASLPLVQLITGSLLVENIWASLLIGSALALLRYQESRNLRLFLLACGLLGTGLATKFGSMAFVAAVLGFLVWSYFQQQKPRRYGLAGFGLFLICAIQPYATAYAKSGNPLFPFLNAIFKSPYYDTKVSFVDHRFTTPVSWHTPYDVTFDTHRFMESDNGAAGFTHFLFLPFFLLTVRRRDGLLASAAFAVGLIFCFLTFRTTSNLRYLYPGLLLWMVPIGWMFSVVQREQRLLFHTLVVAALLTVGFNVYLLPTSGYYHRDFFINILSGKKRVEAYIESSAPVRKIVEYLNEKAPGQPAVFFENNQIAGFHGKAFSNSWHNPRFRDELYASQTVLDELRFMESREIRYFIAPIPEDKASFLPSITPTFLSMFTVPEFRYGGFYLARLKDDFAGPEGIRLATGLLRNLASPTPALHDDIHPSIRYTGTWLHDGHFEEPMEHSISYSNTPGDELRFVFLGTTLKYFYTKAPNRGRCEIVIDGTRRGVIDLYSSKIEWRSSTEFHDLGSGLHNLVLRVLPHKNPASSDRFVDLDGFEVRE